jgi:pilin isopeptide linkage protein
MRLISAVVAVVFAVPVGGVYAGADTPGKWLDRFTTANSSEVAASEPESGIEVDAGEGENVIDVADVVGGESSLEASASEEGALGIKFNQVLGSLAGIQSKTVEGAKVTPAVGTTSKDEGNVTPIVDEGIQTASTEWPEGGFTGETTVTYDANGKGTFVDGATTNVVQTKYTDYMKPMDVTEYAHTDNVDDAGVQNGGYGYYKSYSRVVTIPGVSSLTVDLTYQTEGKESDWVCAYAGGTGSSPAGDAQCFTAGSLTGKLGGKTKTTKSFAVHGDSVTFWFRSDDINSNYYGYYAVVRGMSGSKESVSGAYAAPVDPSGEYEFSSWNTKPDGTGENLGAGEVYLPSSQTVYAQWGISSSYTKWNTVGWRITDDGVLKIRPWEGDTGTTGSVIIPSDAPWKPQASKIKKVESIGNIILNADSARLFYNCSNLTDIAALASWDVSKVMNMSYMFEGCSKLTDLTALKDWNVSKVTDMNRMFEGCSKLTDLTALASWDVSKVMNMSYMFEGCSKFTDLTALAGWNVSKVTDMYGMFQNCSKLTDLTALSDWNVSNVTNMCSMFEGCSSLTGLTALKDWNVSKVTNMRRMFKGCSKLTDLTALKSWNVFNVTDMGYMFQSCSKLTNLTALADWNVSNVTNMSFMFQSCSNITDLTGLKSWNASNVTDMSSMFAGCFNLTNISALADWNVSNVTSMSFMFQSCSNITDLTALKDWNVSNVTNMRSMFYGCFNLTNISALAGWNVSNVENMREMFNGCFSLTDLTALAGWNVSNVTSMYSMFSSCSGLTDLTALAGWNVSNVTSMRSMFSNCSGLTDLTGLASWNVSNVTNMSSMFQNCSKLTDLTALKSWNVSNVTDMYGMFSGCSNLRKVGIPSIANGGQKLVANASTNGLLNSLNSRVITEDLQLGPYTWSELNTEMTTNPEGFTEGHVWVKYTPSWLVSYNANGGVGSMSGAMTPVNQTLTLPEASYLRFCYKFTGWTTQPDSVSDTNPLMKPGQIFDPYDKTDGKRYTLYAQWEKLDNTDDLPSSSQSGMLPGWVQVESGNTTGLIPPSSSITAWFKNKYAPGSTSLSLQFTKLLEGNAPDRVFQFDLYDVAANKVVQSVQNVGSAVKFDPLVFTKEGVYTYYVRESNTTDDKLIYDNSLRQVTVTVTADKDDPSKLTATAQILGDVTFNNKYKTASLKIRKTVEGTEAKDKDFSFMVDVTKSDGSKLEGTYPTQTGDSPGSVTFKNGTATLQLRADEEVAITGLPANSKYTVDETSLPKGYSIKNLSNPDGMLTPADTIEVTAENRYTTTPGIAQLKVLKRYVNAAGQDLPQKNGMFEFAVCEVVSETECNGIGEAQSNDRSEVVFPVISYTDAGNHTYRISEIIGSNTSIAYDRALVTAEVAVTDNGEGELVTTIVYKDKDGNRLPEGELPVFVNRDASASIIPVTGSLAVWSFVAVFGAVALWFASRYIRTPRTGKTGAHAKR